MDEITPAEIRAELLETVLQHLVGPAGGEAETLSQDPRYRYYLGILAPQERRAEDEDDEDINLPPEDDFETTSLSQDDDSVAELPVGRAVPMFEPASYGLSFSVQENPDQPVVLQAQVNYGLYRKAKVDADASGKGQSVWVHQPITAISEPITLKACHQQQIHLKHDVLNAHTGCEKVVSSHLY